MDSYINIKTLKKPEIGFRKKEKIRFSMKRKIVQLKLKSAPIIIIILFLIINSLSPIRINRYDKNPNFNKSNNPGNNNFNIISPKPLDTIIFPTKSPLFYYLQENETYTFLDEHVNCQLVVNANITANIIINITNSSELSPNDLNISCSIVFSENIIPSLVDYYLYLTLEQDFSKYGLNYNESIGDFWNMRYYFRSGFIFGLDLFHKSEITNQEINTEKNIINTNNIETNNIETNNIETNNIIKDSDAPPEIFNPEIDLRISTDNEDTVWAIIKTEYNIYPILNSKFDNSSKILELSTRGFGNWTVLERSTIEGVPIEKQIDGYGYYPIIYSMIIISSLILVIIKKKKKYSIKLYKHYPS